MTAKTHYYNDISYLFEQQPECDWNKMEFTCPVCNKKYRTRAGLEKHMKQQDCAPATKIFADTLTEDLSLAFFKETVGEYNPKQRTSLKALRASKSYKPLMRYILHCMANKQDPYMFFYWITKQKKPKYYNQALSMGLKDSTLIEYRNFLIYNQHLIESEDFFEHNEQEVLNDDWFLVRSLERGDVGLDYCINSENIDLMKRVENMSVGVRSSLANVISKAEGKQ